MPAQSQGFCKFGLLACIAIGSISICTASARNLAHQSLVDSGKQMSSKNHLGFVTASSVHPTINRCAVDPVKDVRNLAQDPPYVMAYHGGKSIYSSWAPFIGDGLVHRQSIQRWASSGYNFLIVSNSVSSGFQPGIEIVALGSKDGILGRLGPNSTIFTPPEASDHVSYFLPFPDLTFNHAGGLQVSGDFVVVPFEGDSGIAGFRLARLLPDSIPDWSETYSRVRGNMNSAGAASLSRLSNGRYVVLVFGWDSKEVEIFLSPSSSLPYFESSDRWVSIGRIDTPVDFRPYQNVQLVTDCSGRTYIVGTHRNGWPSYEDWVDIWSIDFSRVSAPAFRKVGNRNLKCRSSYTSGQRYCDFMAGAGVFVDHAGRVLIYGIEHYSDAFPGDGSAVKFREFYPLNY